ncbi:hypothetical protein T11_9456 [Trichinella zimbabwensis]|uniref:Uncharacterized protein n=1 Tax=Trichinella zimbabwensis TaxID=268475 RepID=A0A0V1HY91_9BILA|nr:hypothetical protein T11_9456 [Trichinella zimbabwensis]
MMHWPHQRLRRLVDDNAEELAVDARGWPLKVVMVSSTRHRDSLTWQLPDICNGVADYRQKDTMFLTFTVDTE